jgi:hypothetical protein
MDDQKHKIERDVIDLPSRKLFQCSLLVKIKTLVTCLKSTLLLKIICFDRPINMKTQCLQTNKMQHYLGKENA